MQVIFLNGKAYTLACRRFKCLACGTLAETSQAHPREFVACVCGEVSIDGGIGAGATVNGTPSRMENHSTYIAEDGSVALASLLLAKNNG
jgi:hypothetical protein